MATVAQRAHISALHQYLAENASKIGYKQARPMTTAKLYEQDLVSLFSKGQIIYPDCSEMQTLVCRMAGLKDPSNMNYDGYGNTDTMYDYLKHYTDPSRGLVGALCIFGPAGATVHVAAVHVPGSDPIMFNHGTSAGPHFVKFSDLAASVTGPATFLDISRL